MKMLQQFLVSVILKNINETNSIRTSLILASCDSNPCRNAGTCTVSGTGNTYTCTCAPGYTGNNCEINIRPGKTLIDLFIVILLFSFYSI